MILCDLGIVLSRRIVNENDRAICLYTKNRGRIYLRFAGVNKPAGKLKALTEPLTWGDFRMYLKPSSESGRGLGGKVLSVFPRIRAEFEKTCCALHFCELVLRLTPDCQPNADKYELLLAGLTALENKGVSEWLRCAFALRLLESAGLGFKETAVGIDSRIWDFLHEEDFQSIIDSPPKAGADILLEIQSIIDRTLENILNYPLRTAGFIKGMGEGRREMVEGEIKR